MRGTRSVVYPTKEISNYVRTIHEWRGEEPSFLNQADEISKSAHKVVSPMGESEGLPLLSMFSFPRKGFFEKSKLRRNEMLFKNYTVCVLLRNAIVRLVYAGARARPTWRTLT